MDDRIGPKKTDDAVQRLEEALKRRFLDRSIGRRALAAARPNKQDSDGNRTYAVWGRSLLELYVLSQKLEATASRGRYLSDLTYLIEHRIHELTTIFSPESIQMVFQKSLSKRSLAEAAERLGIDKLISPLPRGGKSKIVVLSRTVRAIVGAVWFDSQRQMEALFHVIDRMNLVPDSHGCMLTFPCGLGDPSAQDIFATSPVLSDCVVSRSSQQTLSTGIGNDPAADWWTAALDYELPQEWILPTFGVYDGPMNTPIINSVMPEKEQMISSRNIQPQQGASFFHETPFPSATGSGNSNRKLVDPPQASMEALTPIEVFEDHNCRKRHRVPKSKPEKRQRREKMAHSTMLHEWINADTERHRRLGTLWEASCSWSQSAAIQHLKKLNSGQPWKHTLSLCLVRIGGCEAFVQIKELIAHGRFCSTELIRNAPGQDLSLAERYRVVRRLGHEISFTRFLWRCHVLLMVEQCRHQIRDGAEFFVHATAETVLSGPSDGNRPARGNPRYATEADVTARMMQELFPELCKKSPRYRTERRYVSGLRRLGSRLLALRDEFGWGILAVAFLDDLDGQCTPNVSNTILHGLSDADFAQYLRLLRETQAQFLHQLSSRLSIVVLQICHGTMKDAPRLRLESVPDEDIRRQPKGSPVLFSMLDLEATSRPEAQFEQTRVDFQEVMEQYLLGRGF